MADVMRGAEPRSWSDEEKKNVAVVREFVESMGKVDAAERYARYFTAESLARWESPASSAVQWPKDRFIVGAEAMAAGSKKYVNSGLLYETEIHDIYACGPLVVTSRTDTRKMQGEPDRPMKAIGVFIVKDGKILEWTDYMG